MNIDLFRRSLVKKTGISLVSLPILTLVGCGGGGSSSTSASSNTTTSSTTEDTTTTDTQTEETTTESEVEIKWASGGTNLITEDFPNSSVFDSTSQCSKNLTQGTTEGPCYLGVEQRADISDGKEGLPMMLCFQLVDSNCTPLEDYLIEVWHCDNEGIYSGDTSQSDDTSTFAGSFCTDNDTQAENSIWYRGELTTDSEGRVNFKSCFPGWYSGRTIHIHYRIKNDYNEYLVSQFCFTDSFTEEICTEHDLYKSRGVQDTTLSSGNDTVFPASDYNEYIMETKQNSDGSLLAYKRIMITT